MSPATGTNRVGEDSTYKSVILTVHTGDETDKQMVDGRVPGQETCVHVSVSLVLHLGRLRWQETGRLLASHERLKM